MTAQEKLANLPGWKLDAAEKAIFKEYKFRDFAQALEFTNKLGELAELHNHHPDLTLGWGYVGVTFTTHDVGGLRDADFKMAALTDALL